MGAFLGISLWVGLVTVVPGLVTIAALYGAFAVAASNSFQSSLSRLPFSSDWIWSAIAVTIMVLTQAIGILLENFLVRRKWLGAKEKDVVLQKGIDPYGETRFTVWPYQEYKGLYILLAELGKDEDTQGHLKRALAQFFLTINTLVSFSAGLVATVIVGTYVAISTMGTKSALLGEGLYLGLLVLCLWVTYRVAIERFQVMAQSLWVARRKTMAKARLEPVKD